MNGLLLVRKDLWKLSSQARQALHISSARFSHTKTAIQEFGWDYIKRQQNLKRPLSPHLTVYRKQLTWMMSGCHRISGTIMGGTLVVGGIGFALLPIDFTLFVETIRSWNLPFIITDLFKFIIALPITYYTINEVRMLGFEMAKGTKIAQVYRSGYIVIGLALTISLLVIFNSKRQPAIKLKQ